VKVAAEETGMMTDGARPADATRPRPAARRRQRGPQTIIAIGSSTGGVDALRTILVDLPESCPPTLVVQHISGPLSESLAHGLARICRAKVLLAEDGMELSRGQICIAPGNSHHLTLSPGPLPICRLVDRPPVAGHRPSIDVLFRSCAARGPAVRAALLTGMGRDGAHGLLDIRRNGGRTLAQDEATSVVFGMARVAHGLGAVDQMLPLDRIAAALVQPEPRQAHRR
jgi:two-component system chemotaxis response regulator CheB